MGDVFPDPRQQPRDRIHRRSNDNGNTSYGELTQPIFLPERLINYTLFTPTTMSLPPTTSSLAHPRNTPLLDPLTDHPPLAQPADTDHPEAPAPQLRSVSDETNDERSASTSAEIKQAWEAAANGDANPTDLPSTPPRLSTAGAVEGSDPASDPVSNKASNQPPVAPLVASFDAVHHAQLIGLVQQHGGQLLNADDDQLTFTLPPASNLKFQAAYFCALLNMVQDAQPIPDEAAFISAMPARCAELLRQASLAGESSLVRRLLHTGLGDGRLLRALHEEALQAGQPEAALVLTEHWAFWADGANTHPEQRPVEVSFRLGDSEIPPEEWRSQLRRSSFDLRELENICFAPDASCTPAAAAVLFKPGQLPTSGEFFLRCILVDEDYNFVQLLQACGAAVVGIQDNAGLPGLESMLIVYSTDFPKEAVAHQLLDPELPMADAIRWAAAWGDNEIFQSLWKRASDDERASCVQDVLRMAAFAGATSVAKSLLGQPGLRWEDYYHASQQALEMRRFTTADAILSHAAGIPDVKGRVWSVGLSTQLLRDARGNPNDRSIAMLLSHGALTDCDHIFPSPLLTALSNGQIQTAKLLVTAGARLDVTDGDQKSVLSIAAASGDIALYKYFQEVGAEAKVPPHHYAPLVAAAESNQLDMLTYLLDCGYPIDVTNTFGLTPLMIACAGGRTEATKLLLQRGANPMLKTPTGVTAILYAIHSGNLAVLQQLIDALPRWPSWSAGMRLVPLLEAIKRERADMVAALLPVSVLNPRTFSVPVALNPLLAVPYKPTQPADQPPSAHHQILSQLLGNADLPLGHVTTEGMDALMLAVVSQDTHATRLLVDAGLRIGQMSLIERNALHYAFGAIYAVRPPDGSHMVDQNRVKRSSLILEILAKAFLKQDASLRKSLARDVWITCGQHPIMSDLASALMYLNDDLQVDAPAMVNDASPMERTLINQPVGNAPASSAWWAVELQNRYIPSALDHRLIPMFAATAQVQGALRRFDLNSDAALRAMVDGVYLMLEAERDALEKAAAAYYATGPVDVQWQKTLTDVTARWLQARIEAAGVRHANEIVPVVAGLLDTCISLTVNQAPLADALQRGQPEPRKVEKALYEAGIYAPYARELDAAWTQAWATVREQLPLSGAAAANDAPDREALSDDALSNALLRTFQDILRQRIDTVSNDGNIILRIDAPPVEAAIYADLMMQQLYLLRQFIYSDTGADLSTDAGKQ